MKRILSLSLSLSLLLCLLASCGAGSQPSADPAPITPEPSASAPAAAELSVTGLAETLLLYSGCESPDTAERLNSETDANALASYVEHAYGLDPDAWDGAAVIRAAGASAFELAVLRFVDEDAAQQSEAPLKEYLRSREGDFSKYAPAQADMAAGGEVAQTGVWAGLFICPNAEEARAAFTAALNGRPLPEQPAPAPTAEPATGMELLRDIALDRCGDELAELGGYSVSMYREREDFSQMIEDTYGISSDLIADGFAIDDTGGAFFEVVVLQMTSQQAAEEAMDTFVTYSYHLMVVQGVLPEENRASHEYIMSHFTAGAITEFVYFAICQDKDSVQSAFRSAIDSIIRAQSQQKPAPQPKEIADGIFFIDVSSAELKGEPDPSHPGRARHVQPNKEDMSVYDSSAIIDAWAAGNPDQLSAYDRAIYDSAKNILGAILEDGMDAFSKEAAIYEWVIQNVAYDWSHTDITKETSRDSYTPYGGLVNHTAVCLGYATTFQLLAELAGIQCVTVAGAAAGADHAWNQVCLDGTWYCVDLTWEWSYWNDGRMNGREWRYFNTTSDYMARTWHTWDYDAVPEATAEDHGCPRGTAAQKDSPAAL